MGRPSRRFTRQIALQALYAWSAWACRDLDLFLAELYDERLRSMADRPYLEKVVATVVVHEWELLGVIATLAPRFDLATMPTIHIIALMIALAEQRFGPEIGDPIPEAISISEAMELARIFSDDAGKDFVNGVLGMYARSKDTLGEPKVITPFLFV